MSKPELTAEYFGLLQNLQAIDFVLTELTLYLDTHPDDRVAITQYRAGAQMRAQVAANYEARYGPLVHMGRDAARTPQTWADGPWPWEV